MEKERKRKKERKRVKASVVLHIRDTHQAYLCISIYVYTCVGTYVDIYLCIYTYAHARIQNMYNIPMKDERKRIKKSNEKK